MFPYPPDVAQLNENDTEVAKTVIDLWTSFAATGVPEVNKNHDGINELTWQPFLGMNRILNFEGTMPNFYCFCFRTGPTGAYMHIDKNLQLDDDYRQEFLLETRNNSARATIH